MFEELWSKCVQESKFPCFFLTFVIDKVCMTIEDWQIVKEDLSRVVYIPEPGRITDRQQIHREQYAD